MLDRRELLKFFGIGTVITPVLGGQPIVEASAQLLAEPDIKPILVDSFPDGHTPRHFSDRLKWNPYEEIWLRAWQIENNPSSGVNSGIGPLEHILKRRPTADEKAAVAGVIQWFGTNCGRGFIEEAQQLCGYRTRFDESLPNAREIHNLQYGNVWKRGECRDVTIRFYGRSFTLKPEVGQQAKDGVA